MVASIGAIASAVQGTSYYERDGYYAKDDPEHRAASGWTGRGAEALGLSGPVDPHTFRAVLEGKVPDGSGRALGRRDGDGTLVHRPGRDVTLSAPKSVSLAALVGGDGRVVDVHDRAVAATLAWIEKHAVETRMKDPETGRLARAGDQKMVAATFRHDTSRNLDPQLHTHAVIANMVQGADGKWRTMANEKLYESKMLIGAIYRSELARGLGRLGYEVEKTHADGRFEVAGVSREVIEAFSTRRSEIEAGMAERGMGAPGENPRLAERAALMSRAAKRDVDRAELGHHWQRQAADLGFDAPALAAEARAAERAAAAREAERDTPGAGREHRAGAGDGPASVRGDGPASSPSRPRRGRGSTATVARGPGGRMGGGAPRRARGGVLAHRAAHLCARLGPRQGDGRRGRGRRRRARGGGYAARGADAGHGRVADHRARGGRREGDHRAHGGGARAHQGAHAPPRGGQGASQRPAHRRPEGGDQAHPLGRRPGGRRPGLCRERQDHHAEPRPGAP